MTDILSIDVGTTNLKISLFNEQYNQLDVYRYTYQEIKSDSLIYELNMMEIFQAIRGGILVLSAQNHIKQFDIVLTTAMHSIQCVTEDMKLIGRTRTWADRRGAEAVNDKDLGSLATQYTNTGTPNHSMNPYFKLMSMKEKLKYKKITSIKDMLFYLLTNEWVIDVANAASSGLYNLHTKKWDTALLADLNLNENQLPKIKMPNYQAKLVNHNNQFKDIEANVYLGTSDGVSSNYAFRNLNNSAVLSIGTSHAVRTVEPKVLVDTSTQNFCYQIDQNHYLVGYPSNNGANVIRWVIQAFKVTMQEIEDIILKEKKSRGVFFPFLSGERAPIWDDYIQASYDGIQRDVDQKQLIYTMISGMVFNIKHNVENLKDKATFDKVGVVGGAIKIPELIQLIANALNLPLYIPKTEYAETLGTIALIKDNIIDLEYTIIKPQKDKVKILEYEYVNYRNKLDKYLES